MNSDWSHSKLVVLLPLLAVVVLYASYLSVRNSFFVCDGNSWCTESIPLNVWKVLKFNAEPAPSTTSATDLALRDNKLREATALKYGGRMTWYFLVMVYSFVCIAALAVAFITIFKLSPQRRVLWTCVSFVICFLVALILYKKPEIHMKIFLAIFEKSPTEKTIPTDVPAIAGLTNFLDSVGNAAAFAVLLASCATLWPAHERSLPEGLRQLSQRMKYLRTILYSGTLLLVVTILLKSSIYQWSLAFTSREDAAVKTASAFVSSLLSVEGGFYTLVLVAVYLPAAVILQRRANHLEGLPADEAARKKVLQENGMTFSFSESLPRILAILAPVLTGPIGDLLKRGG